MPPFGLSRSTVVLLAVALAVVLALAGRRLAAGGAAGPTAVVALAPSGAPDGGGGAAAAASPAQLVVHVVGAVRRPGLYRLAEGARVADAVRRAGGATRRADLSGVNLAQPLPDGAQVIVPARLPSAGPGASPGEGVPGLAGGKVHLSTATVAELDALPGVGPVTAEKIVAWRTEHGPFASVDDLDAIPGIGPARLDQLRDLVAP